MDHGELTGAIGMSAVLERLNTIAFVDLSVGDGYCEVQRAGPDGVVHLDPLDPDGDAPLIHALRERCLHEAERAQSREFGFRVGNVVYRVTAIRDGDLSMRGAGGGNVEFSIRKSNAAVRAIGELGLPAPVMRTVMSPSLAGLVLVVGKSGAGKTSTVASLLLERLRRFGGVGRTIEQPREIALEGRHGAGRCRQTEVGNERDFEEAISLALRTSPAAIALGEIRLEQSARAAVLAGLNGHLILTTMHAKSVEDGVERLSALAGGVLNNARDLVAAGLALVIHQRLESVGGTMRLMTRSLSLADDGVGVSVRAKIRDGRMSSLSQEVAQQEAQYVHAWRGS